MSYTYKTLAQAKTDLASRLNDSGKVYWIDAELELYLRESLQTWNSLSMFFRDRYTLNLTIGEPYYNLSTVLDTTALGKTIRSNVLAHMIQVNLSEPISNDWNGSAQFTIDDLNQAIQRRQDKFLQETEMGQEVILVDVPSAPQGRVQLDESISHVHRASWIYIDANGDTQRKVLFQSDPISLTSYSRGWDLDSTLPLAFSQISTPVLTLQLAPIPSDTGTLKLIVQKAGGTIDYQDPVALDVIDDWIWVIKWGVLAELLSKDGISQDLPRAQFCEEMWQKGLDAAKNAGSVLNGDINGQNCYFTSLWDADVNSSVWESFSGSTSTLATSGYNLLVAIPAPAIDTSVSLDIHRQAPLPASDSEYLQVPREYYDIILDYSISLASFKEASVEFQATLPLNNKLWQEATNFRKRLMAQGGDFEALKGTSNREHEQRPSMIGPDGNER